MTKEMMMPSFVTKYCRMCAVELKAGVFIFGEEGKRLHLPEKIRKTLAILVLEEDSLPKKICTDCCSSLEDYAQYKETVLDAQEKLASIAKNVGNVNIGGGHTENVKSTSSHHHHNVGRGKSIDRLETETQTDEGPSSSSKSSSSSHQSQKNPSSGDFLVRCGLCPSNTKETFDDRQKVSAHFAKSHGDSRHQSLGYRCPQCPKVTERFSMLRVHMQRHHHRSRTNNESVNTHQASSSSIKTFVSIDATPTRLSKSDQQPVMEGKSLSCKECGKRFYSRKSLEDHTSCRHCFSKEPVSGVEESCQDFSDSSLPDCGDYDDDEDDLEAESEDVIRQSDVGLQRSSVVQEEKLECVNRQKSVAKVPVFLSRGGGGGGGGSENRLDLGRDDEHTQSNFQKKDDGKYDGKIWNCNICNKSLTSNTGYHNHMMVHKGRKFDCNQCGVSYLQKATLLHHMKVHHVAVPKKYKCSACGKEFHELKFLTQHAKIHSTPSQEFQCNICQKIYKTGRCLRRHVKLHSSNKKYVCNMCGKAFRVKSKLDEHENSHTGKRPLGCNFCDKAFNGHPNYVKHIRRKHPQEISRENKIPPPKKQDSRVTSGVAGICNNEPSSPPPSAPPSAQPPPPLPPPQPVSSSQSCLIPTPAHTCEIQLQSQSIPSQSGAYSSVSGKNFNNPSGGGGSNGQSSLCSGPASASVNALDLMDCAIQSALAGESASGNTGGYENHPVQSQSEPMELSYKLESSAFQDMPMELTKVFQRDPLELCVRQDLNLSGSNPLMDLSSRVDTSGIVSMSMNMAGVNVHKLDLTERELMDLSGAFRQPIDLIARTDDTPHDLYNEGSLVDLSLRSTFGQDQSASSFLRELIDLSARSDSFHGELDLTKPHHSHGNTQQQHSHASGVPSTASTSSTISPKNGPGGTNVGTSLQNVVYQDAMFSLQN